jgi:hypothetical protein
MILTPSEESYLFVSLADLLKHKNVNKTLEVYKAVLTKKLAQQSDEIRQYYLKP